MATSDFSCEQNTFFSGSHHCAAQVPKKCTDLDRTLLYIFVWGTCSKFAQLFFSALCLLTTALLERWPQVCRVKMTFTVLPTNRFVSTTKNSMKYVVNWVPLRIRVRSRNTQSHLDYWFYPRSSNLRSCLLSYFTYFKVIKVMIIIMIMVSLHVPWIANPNNCIMYRYTLKRALHTCKNEM